MNDFLIVMNDEVEKEKIKDYLKKMGRKITEEFSEVKKAINYLHNNKKIDIVVTETRLPGVFDGMDFSLLINKQFPEIKVIFFLEKTEKLKGSMESVKSISAVINKPADEISFDSAVRLSEIHYHSDINKNLKQQNILKDYETIIDHTNDAIFLIEVDREHNFYFKRLNRTHQKLTGLTNKEVVGKTPIELFGPEMGKKLEANYRNCLEQQEIQSYNEVLVFPAGEKVWHTKLYPVKRNGRVVEIVGSSQDITTKEQKKKELHYISYHDQLTALYNRQFFMRELERLDREQYLPLSIIVVDINALKIINNFFGHESGDRLLINTADILKKSIRKRDIIARWGGDEFAILLPNTSLKDSGRIMKRIFSNLHKNSDSTFPLSIAAGSAVRTDMLENTETLFNRAEDSMYINKSKIKNDLNNPFIDYILKKIETENYYPVRHSPNFMKSVEISAEIFGLDKEEFVLLSRIHDIGKLAVKDSILKKGDQLTESEWVEYRHHVEAGYNFAFSFKALNNTADLVLHHHEYWDGSGYPDGWSEDEIPFKIRILSVIDFYDAFRSNLFYPLEKENYFFASLNKSQSISELKKYSGTKLDPEIVDIFTDRVISRLERA